MKKDIELIKQYPPWCKEKKEDIKIGFLIFIFGLILMIAMTFTCFYGVKISSFPLYQIIIGLVLINLLPGAACWLGLTSFVGDLSGSIIDSYRLRKYNKKGKEINEV